MSRRQRMRDWRFTVEDLPCEDPLNGFHIVYANKSVNNEPDWVIKYCKANPEWHPYVNGKRSV